MPAPEQMQVQMVHGLASVVARVHDDAIAIVQFLPPRNLRRSSHEMSHQRKVFGQCLCRGCNVLLGNYQQMRRGLRIDIRKADAGLVFVDTARWYGARDDLAKQAIRRRGRKWSRA